MEKRSTTRDMAYMAMYLALFVVLDWVSNQIGVFKMPQGGTLGLGIIPLILASYHLGPEKGVAVGVLSCVLQFITGTMYIVTRQDGFNLFGIVLQFLLEYPIAFGVYGISCLFPNEGNLYTGIVVTNLIRLAIHVVAGVVYWKTPWWGSFTYNAWYMIPTMIAALIIVPIMAPRLKTFMK